MTNKKSLEEMNGNIFDFQKDESLIDLKRAIEEQCLIVFWGAGVSRLGGCQGWKGLTEVVIKKLTDAGVLSFSDSSTLLEICARDLKKALTICRNISNKSGKSDVYFDAIINSVTPPDHLRAIFEQAHKSLIELEAYAYITTNIDKGIESVKSLFSQNQRVFDLTSDENLKEDWSPYVRDGNIFYLHGTTDNIEKSIFSTDSYHEFYNGSKIEKFLDTVFSTNAVVLFVGYGLEDYEILSHLYLAKKRVSDEARINLRYSYYLCPIFQKENDMLSIEREFLEIYNIIPIAYYIDYQDYGLMLDILSQLKNKINELRYSQDPVPKLN